jgi:hypothetical protein
LYEKRMERQLKAVMKLTFKCQRMKF